MTTLPPTRRDGPQADTSADPPPSKTTLRRALAAAEAAEARAAAEVAYFRCWLVDVEAREAAEANLRLAEYYEIWAANEAAYRRRVLANFKAKAADLRRRLADVEATAVELQRELADDEARAREAAVEAEAARLRRASDYPDDYYPDD